MKLSDASVKPLFQNPDVTKEFLVRFLPLLHSWLNGGFIEGKRKYTAKNIEFSSTKDDFQYLVTWLVGFRGCGKVQPQTPLFFASREKKESKAGRTLQWKYSKSELTTWVPDAVGAIGGAENQGSNLFTTLLQCNDLPKSALLMDYTLLLAVFAWLKSNKTWLFKQAGFSPKDAAVRKPNWNSLLKTLTTDVSKHRYFLVYLKKQKLSVTVAGSWDAAGG